ncbi:MAG TPA: peptidylprolyl isomerase, partial [Opitutaceae bacterium]|nr:peptidylprolyl isomerase [Opitutaceae bacterium]
MIPICRIVACLGLLGALTLRAQSDTSPTVTQQLPAQSGSTGGAPLTVDLKNYFGLPGVANQVVRFNTVLGPIHVEMLPDTAPNHVTNFLTYVNSGAYNNTFFHRSTALNGSSTAPVDIIQGGGYRIPVDPAVTRIPSNAPVNLEYNRLNERGTLAAARTSDANSATSEWFFNVRDNSTTLNAENGGGYTVFARVVGGGMNTVDAIAALSRKNEGGAFSTLPVRNLAVPSTDSNLVVVTSIVPVSVYPGQGSPAVLTFSAESSNPAVATVSVTNSTLTITPGTQAGETNIVVRAADANGSLATASFVTSVALSNAPPTILRAPVSQTVAQGGFAVFSVVATGTNLQYEWRRNNEPVAGANGPTLLVRNVNTGNTGSYTVAVSNSIGISVTTPVTLTSTTAAPARLTNFSIRAMTGTGARTLTAGFVAGGAANSSLLVRGVGPGLIAHQVPSVLDNPRLDLYSGDTLLATNDDWSGDDGRSLGAFPLTEGSKDAVLIRSVAAGAYTAQVNSVSGANGNALVEVYDRNAASPVSGVDLVNVSARSQLVDNEVLIGGFVLTGSSNRTVLIRAIGPTLAKFQVAGVLANPRIELYRDGVKINENDDWSGSAAIEAARAEVGAFAVEDPAVPVGLGELVE